MQKATRQLLALAGGGVNMIKQENLPVLQKKSSEQKPM